MDLLTNFPELDMLSTVSDFMPNSLRFGRRFEVDIPSRDSWNNGGALLDPKDIVWYTDGSKMDSVVGAGVYGPYHKVSKPLGRSPIEICASINLHILTDSQAALKALISHLISSKSVLSCFDSLRNLAQYNKIKL